MPQRKTEAKPSPPLMSVLLQLAATLAVVLLATGGELLLSKLAVHSRYFLLCGAVIFNAFLSGWTGGLLATGLSLLSILARMRLVSHAPFFALENVVANLVFVLLCLAETWIVVQLVRARTEAEHAATLRDELLSMVAHDVRTPLGAISLQLQTALRKARKAGDDSLARASLELGLAASHRHVDRINELLSTLLDASSLDSGRVQLVLAEGDLCQAVRNVVERSTDALQHAGCLLELELPPSLPGRWDLLRCEQIVTNLLSNAIKYGSGRPIHLSLSLVDEQACLSIADEGIGIARAQQDTIFQRFERVDALGAVKGHGVGLWSVHCLVEAMNGSISVQSVPGEGSTFTVWLPRLSSSPSERPDVHVG